ncbi:MAG: hypothetical protein E6312_01000 [Peptoniphilus grossensis]|uniref:YfjL-like protein n=1 Tax=Peptoniphilus grossensis TaxID=1465756 RepID=UPI00290F27D3|nr:hypothetical protein [Peptoniphilus grossensis]MDU7150629.1 hypothetical protein [Peptoniphilus grossensis]
MSKGKASKVFIGLFIFLAIIFAFICLAFFGNPISRLMAEKSATKYIEAHYKDLDLNRDRAYYNFKDGYYTVRLRSKTSKDTAFMLGFDSFGKLKQNTYDDILFNTEIRLLDELRGYGADLQYKYNFPYEISLNTVEDVPRENLVLDQEFDFDNFKEDVNAQAFGYVEKPSLEECLDILCDLQKIMDKTSLKVTKYSIILIPEENKKPDGEAESWAGSVNVYDVPAEVVRNKDIKEFINIYERSISETKD